MGPHIVDFVCLEKRLIVEVDGGHHAAQAENDAHRTARLEAEDFRVLRFWNTEVLRDPIAVQEAIRAALEDGRPPTSILPRKGGGGRRPRERLERELQRRQREQRRQEQQQLRPCRAGRLVIGPDCYAFRALWRPVAGAYDTRPERA